MYESAEDSSSSKISSDSFPRLASSGAESYAEAFKLSILLVSLPFLCESGGAAFLS